jgi:hypothetical protein
MPTDTEMLTRILNGQGEANLLLTDLVELLEADQQLKKDIVTKLVDLEAWLKEPPKNDLGDLLKRLAAALEGVQQNMVELPAAVARAVLSGELPGRG